MNAGKGVVLDPLFTILAREDLHSTAAMTKQPRQP
jgi:hypothetical protein